MSENKLEFREWPKIPRINKFQLVLSEKIDGTNACVVFSEDGKDILCQSRKRVIVPGDDNMGFAKFAHDNRDLLFETLGPGRHFGEWWGLGIQRTYDMPHKVFSLFNLHQHQRLFHTPVECTEGNFLSCVPPMSYSNSTERVTKLAKEMTHSHAAMQFGVTYERPEGLVAYEVASGKLYKAIKDK